MSPGRARLSPIVACVVLYALLLVAWQAWVYPHLPEAPRRGPAGATLPFGAPFPVEDEILYVNGPLSGARAAVAGDSRVFEGIHQDVLDDAGLGPSAQVWGAMAQTVDLVRFVRDFPVRRLVLAVAPTSVYSSPRIVAQQRLVRGPRARGEEPTPEELAALTAEWSEVARVAFSDRPMGEAELDAFVQRLLRTHGVTGEPEERTGATRFALGAWKATRRIDQELGVWLDEQRASLIGTLQTRTWHRSWFPVNDPTICDAEYRKTLAPATRERRDQAFEELHVALERLADEGWELVCVRLPVAPELLAIEEAAFRGARFAELCASLGVPYLDYSGEDGYTTRDGSHLTLPSGRRFSERLARDLARLTDWTDAAR